MREGDRVTLAWCKALPKVELHVHLESAMSFDCFMELQKRSAKSEVLSISETKARLDCTTDRNECSRLEYFFDTWKWKNSFIRTIEDYELIAASAARCQADDGIVYGEMFFSPFVTKTLNLDLHGVVNAIIRGFSSEPRIQMKLIADLTRDYGERACRWLIEELATIRNPSLVGIGIGGSEHKFPAKKFKLAYDQARLSGFHCNAHAGEMAGARSVQDAAYFLRAERIGHATRAIEDPDLLLALAEKKITIEACPTANLCTGTIKNLSDYPLPAFMAAAVPMCINTDNPLLFGRRLAKELYDVAQCFKLSQAQVLDLQQNALAAAWIDHSERAVLQEKLQKFST